MKSNQDLNIFIVLRWITRALSTVLVLFIVLMLLSYTFGPERTVPGTAMLVVLSLFTLGAGLAWKWTGLGGLVMLAGSVLLFTLYPHILWPPGFYHLMPVMAVLSILLWFNLRKPQTGNLDHKNTS